MFCKKCGKEVADNSVYCKYCGDLLNPDIVKKRRLFSSLVKNITPLSKGWQIAIMSYVIWIFLFIILWKAECLPYDEEGLFFFIFVICLPVIALFVWHYITHLRHLTKKNNLIGTDLSVNKEKEISPTTVFSIKPLVLFAKEYGKMQVVKETCPDSKVHRYCVFTSDSGVCTKVYFSQTTRELDASSISQNKESLFVVSGPGSSHKLVHSCPEKFYQSVSCLPYAASGTITGKEG